MSSDLTGEVYVVGKDNGGAVDGKTLDGVPTATGTGGAGATSRAAAVASIGGLSNWGIVVALIAVLGLIVGLI